MGDAASPTASLCSKASTRAPAERTVSALRASASLSCAFSARIVRSRARAMAAAFCGCASPEASSTMSSSRSMEDDSDAIVAVSSFRGPRRWPATRTTRREAQTAAASSRAEWPRSSAHFGNSRVKKAGIRRNRAAVPVARCGGAAGRGGGAEDGGCGWGSREAKSPGVSRDAVVAASARKTESRKPAPARVTARRRTRRTRVSDVARGAALPRAHHARSPPQ